MMPELGQMALILALILAAVQAVFPLLGAWRGSSALMRMARPAVAGQFVFMVLAYAVLTHAFMVNDFSVRYVAENSNLTLPWYYRFSAVWGAHAGSLLLWVLILNVWTLAVAVFSRRLPEAFVARVLGIMGLVSVGFLSFSVLTSNPFLRVLPAPVNGMDLNPVLQDPGLVMHPPMLYMGYVGFSVAFAFAIAALLGGAFDDVWVRWARPWTNAAFGFLSAGIVLGSWWSYAELGWGGWWFWDPVENASFMPWLVGAALIHAQAVTEKRGGLRAWTLLLSIFAFSLSLIGTFLVRSGVLVSVHSFATDPRRGLFILAGLAVTVGGSLGLYAWRAPKLYVPGGFELFSREFFLVVNNVLLVAAAGLVLWGTLAPLFYELLGIGKISVGPPVFNLMFLVPMLPMLGFLAIGMHAAWRRGRLTTVAKPIWILLVVGLVLAFVILRYGYGSLPWAGFAGMTFGVWIILSALLEPLRRIRQRQTLTTALVGMTIAHIGVGMFAIAVSTVSNFKIDKDVALKPGQTFSIAGYDFKFLSTKPVFGPNYEAVQGTFDVTHDGRPVATLTPQKRRFVVQQIDNSHAAITFNWGRDLFVAMGNSLGEGAWSLRIQYKPLMRYVWLGALLMAVGGGVCASDRRYRVKAAATAEDRVARAPGPDPKPSAGVA